MHLLQKRDTAGSSGFHENPDRSEAALADLPHGNPLCPPMLMSLRMSASRSSVLS